MRWLPMLLGLMLSACQVTVGPSPVPQQPAPVAQLGSGQSLSPDQAARSFTQVARAVRPVAVQECRRLAPGVDCNFRIVVDPNPRAAPNAYQSQGFHRTAGADLHRNADFQRAQCR